MKKKGCPLDSLQRGDYLLLTPRTRERQYDSLPLGQLECERVQLSRSVNNDHPRFQRRGADRNHWASACPHLRKYQSSLGRGTEYPIEVVSRERVDRLDAVDHGVAVQVHERVVPRQEAAVDCAQDLGGLDGGLKFSYREYRGFAVVGDEFRNDPPFRLVESDERLDVPSHKQDAGGRPAPTLVITENGRRYLHLFGEEHLLNPQLLSPSLQRSAGVATCDDVAGYLGEGIGVCRLQVSLIIGGLDL